MTKHIYIIIVTIRFYAIKIVAELTEVLRHKLCMFEVPIYGPTSVYCDIEAVLKMLYYISLFELKYHSIAYHRYREAVSAQTVHMAT